MKVTNKYKQPSTRLMFLQSDTFHCFHWHRGEEHDPRVISKALNVGGVSQMKTDYKSASLSIPTVIRADRVRKVVFCGYSVHTGLLFFAFVLRTKSIYAVLIDSSQVYKALFMFFSRVTPLGVCHPPASCERKWITVT